MIFLGLIIFLIIYIISAKKDANIENQKLRDILIEKNNGQMQEISKAFENFTDKDVEQLVEEMKNWKKAQVK